RAGAALTGPSGRGASLPAGHDACWTGGGITMRISHPSRRDLLKLGALGLGSAALPLTRLRLGLADNGSESSPSPIDPPFTHSLTPEGVPPVLARVPGGPPPGVIVEVNDPRLAN